MRRKGTELAKEGKINEAIATFEKAQELFPGQFMDFYSGGAATIEAEPECLPDSDGYVLDAKAVAHWLAAKSKSEEPTGG